MSEGLLTEFYKKIIYGDDVEKNKAIKEYLPYALGRKPTTGDYKMMYKLVRDFGHQIMFASLVDFSYSNVDSNGSFWGYIVGICKNRLEEMIQSYADEGEYGATLTLLEEIEEITDSINYEEREKILEGMYE